MKANKFLIIVIILLGFFSCTKDVSVSPPEGETLINNKVFVTSVPTNAKIYYNYKYTGYNTPDTVKFLSSGKVDLTLKLKYFKDYEIEVETGQETVPEISLNFYDLSGIKGFAKINTVPENTTLEIDDSTISYTSGQVLGMYPGKYNVKLKADEHREASGEIEIYSQTTKEYFIGLTDTSGVVVYDKENYDFTSDNIDMLETDYSHICWFVSNNKIGYIKNEKVNYFDENMLPVSNAIFYDIFVASDNTKWFATSQGIVSLKDNVVNLFDNTSNVISGKIHSLSEDLSGKIWYAGDNGFGYLENGKGTNYGSTDLGLDAGTKFYSVEHSGTGEILIGATNYIVIWKNFNEAVKYEPVKEADRQTQTGYYNVSVSNITTDINGKVWFTVTTDEAEFFDKIFSLTNNECELKVQSPRKFSNIEEVRNNQLICGGAYMIKTFSAAKLKSSLLSDYLSGGFNLDIKNLALAKNRDEIWLATNYGIAKVKTSVINQWCDN